MTDARRPAGRGRRHQDGGRGRRGDRDRRPGQRHRHRRRPEVRRLGHPAGPRHRRHHRWRHRADLRAERELLQHPDPAVRHVHLHPQRRRRRRRSRSPSPASTTTRSRSTTRRPWPRTPRPTAVDVLANDTDVDAGPKSIQSVTQPANGTVVITGGGTGLTYAPERQLLQQPARHHAGHVHLHAGSRWLDRDGVRDGHLRRRPAHRGQRLRDGRRGRRAPPRSPCSPTTPTSTPGRRRSPRSPSPRNGTVAIIGGGAGLTYAPNAELLQQPARHHARHVHLHPQRWLERDRVDDGHLRRRRARWRSTTPRPSPRTARPPRSTSWPTTPTSTADPRAIASVTQPANGTVVITGGGTGLTYQPNANYCNSPTAAVRHLHLHPHSGRLHRHGQRDRHLRRRPAGRRWTTPRRWPRTRVRPRSPCWPTTPTSTAARRASPRSPSRPTAPSSSPVAAPA